MARRVHLWFDYVSPYAYLALTRPGVAERFDTRPDG